jgi:hypothetical protein
MPEPRRRQLAVAHRVRDVLMPEVSLQRAGVVARWQVSGLFLHAGVSPGAVRMRKTRERRRQNLRLVTIEVP